MTSQTDTYTTTMTITLTPMSSSASNFRSVHDRSATTDTATTDTATFLHPLSGGSRPRIIRQVSQPSMGTDQSDRVAMQVVNSQRFGIQDQQNLVKEPSTDLTELKATANRLKLTTRRPSYLAWLEDHFPDGELVPNSAKIFSEKPREDETDKTSAVSMTFHIKLYGIAVNDHDSKRNEKEDVLLKCKQSDSEKLTRERTEKIEESLRWIKDELRMMKEDDQVLARKLLHLYQDIHRVRLSRSCQKHREHLDDIRSDLEESSELSHVIDLPRTSLLDGPLKQLGVTRLNINTRRFSTC